MTITSEPKFLGLIVYQISLAMELRWRALPAGSAINDDDDDDDDDDDVFDGLYIYIYFFFNNDFISKTKKQLQSKQTVKSY